MEQSTEVLLRNRSIWADFFDYVDSKTGWEQLIVYLVLALLFQFIQRLEFVIITRWIRLLVKKTPKLVFFEGFSVSRAHMGPLPRLSTECYPDASPEAQSAVGYDSAEEEEASRHQVLWTNIMDEGKYQNPSLYDKVEVLLLCWKDPDMDTTSEVEDLRTVFVDDFGYHATTEFLNANSEKKLQVQVNARVAKFVEDYGCCSNTLLIVYYAGHGGPGEFFGDLVLHGKTSPNDSRPARERARNCLVWNKTEELLRPAEADVLEIFDCCYAGSIGLSRGETRLFEYLAAVKGHGTTGVPGPTSFTRALIFALKALARDKKEGRFTTAELLRKIKTDAPDFPKDQTPAMSNRDNKNPSAGRIMLHPLRQKRPSDVANEECPIKRAATGYVMTLHFDFGNKPPDDNLRTLGMNLNTIFERNALEVHRVRWGGLKATMFTRATRKFQKTLMMKRRASSQGQQPIIIVPCSTSSTGQMNSSLLSPNAVVFDGHESGGEDSGSAVTTSSPPTPADLSPKRSTKDELGLLEVVGESPLLETLKERFG
ncbi:MAG: hypothetical protein Q9226_007293 [Calogaya cf. arnoldii]